MKILNGIQDQSDLKLNSKLLIKSFTLIIIISILLTYIIMIPIAVTDSKQNISSVSETTVNKENERKETESSKDSSVTSSCEVAPQTTGAFSTDNNDLSTNSEAKEKAEQPEQAIEHKNESIIENEPNSYVPPTLEASSSEVYFIQIWNYLKNKFEYNDNVCAGILGNIMTECGGQTLEGINPWSDGGCGYGLIQWTSGRASKLFSIYGNHPSIEQQLEYMKTEFEAGQFMNKGLYNFNSFINSNSPEDAALAFAKCYERCGAGSYSKRQANARIAYNYFIKN